MLANLPIVMFADNTPYTFQANLFLGARTNLRVHGSHEGRKHLFGDPSGNLESPQTFNKSPLIFDKFHRSSIAHNLVDIYEGVTLSYGPNGQELYEPFTPFMRDSDGGISTYFYSGDRHANKITGDIVLDCGFTKLFGQMTTAGTYRYI